MDAFLLAVAILCSDAKTLRVEQIVGSNPITHAECDLLSESATIKQVYIKPLNINGCERILLCTEVGWKNIPQ